MMDYWECDDVPMQDMVGKTFTNVFVNKEDDEIHFTCAEGTYIMFHQQSCCESVEIESIVGDIKDLENTPILGAEESSGTGTTDWGSSTWTFYKLRSAKGYVDIRWIGESNGYYSESVDLVFKKGEVK